MQLLPLSSGFKLLRNCTAEGCVDLIDDAEPNVNSTAAQNGEFVCSGVPKVKF